MRKFLAGLALALPGAAMALGGAHADDRLGLAVVAWVHSIDAFPDWTARMSGLSLDEASGTATIEKLSLAAEAGGLSIDIEGVKLIGFATAAEGGFTATSLEVSAATVKTAGADIELTNAKIEDIGVPSLAGIGFQKSKPFTSLLPALAAVAESRAARAKIAEIVFVEKFEGVSSRIAYRNVAIGRLADGKIDTLAMGPLLVDSPSPNPLVELNVANAKASGIDLDAFLHVYDPLRYVAGVGDRKWRTAVARADYADIVMTAPGVGLKLGSASIENFSLRQPKEAFAPFVDAMTTEKAVSSAAMDAMRSRYLADLLSAYGAGRFTLSDVSLSASGIDELSFDRFVLAEASSDRIGEVVIEGFTGAVAGQGAVAAGRLALTDILPPPAERLVAAFDLAQRGFDVDFSALAPRLSALEAVDVDIQAIDFPGAALGQLRADFDNYVGSVPMDVVVGIDGLDIAAASLWPARARSLIAGLGYERIRADAAFGLSWRESDGTLSLEDFSLDIEDFGKTTADIVLAGLTRDAIERSDGTAILADLLFDRANLTFEDKSVVERSLSMRADLLKIPLDRLKQQLAGALPLMLAFVGNTEMVQKLVPVLQTFIKTPGTLTVKAAPSPPVPVTAIENALRTRPQSLPGMLSISVSGTPGPGGEAAPDSPEKAGDLGESPAIRETIEPDSRPGSTGSTSPSPAAPP